MQEIDNILYSDEASFYLNGSINKQNNRRYAPLKKHNPVQGGRPANSVHKKPTYDPHIMVFCGLKRDGVFGLKIYHQGTMTGAWYHSLLQCKVLPEIRNWNGGNFILVLRWCTCAYYNYKDHLFPLKPLNLLQLKQNIKREVASISAPIASKVIRSMKTGAQLCLASCTGYFEVWETRCCSKSLIFFS